MIIDFHTHTFPDNIASKVIKHLGTEVACIKSYTEGTSTQLLSSMKEAGVDYSVCLPVMTNENQVEKLNASIIEQQESAFSQGMILFGGMHPNYQNYRQELQKLASHGIKGIKLHPAYQGIDLDDIRFLRIMDAATEFGLIVSVHAGIDIGIYDHNYASVPHILHVLDEVHPDRFVLAHMGNWGCWDDVEKYLSGAPIWLDTSFSLGPIYKNPQAIKDPIREYNLPDEDFIRLIRKHGTDRILFATDSPWQGQKDDVAYLNKMPISEKERQMIFSENAIKLLKL